jgi:hypothetical protein
VGGPGRTAATSPATDLQLLRSRPVGTIAGGSTHLFLSWQGRVPGREGIAVAVPKAAQPAAQRANGGKGVLVAATGSSGAPRLSEYARRHQAGRSCRLGRPVNLFGRHRVGLQVVNWPVFLCRPCLVDNLRQRLSRNSEGVVGRQRHCTG